MALSYYERKQNREDAAALLDRDLKDNEVVYRDPNGKILIFENMSTYKLYLNNSDRYILKNIDGVITAIDLNPNSVFKRKCPICGTEFWVEDASTVKTYCSINCESFAKRSPLAQQYLKLPNPYGINYFGKQIPMIDIIAGINIGRQLAEHEKGYPIDGNPNNLDPSNIRLGTKFKDRANSVKKITRICKNCRKEFEFIPDSRTIETREFCSKSCARQSTIGQNTKNKNPYRELYKPGYPGAKVNGKIMEHRYIAQEEILHRVMKPEERIIHKDGVNLHNDPSNLLVVDSAKSANIYQYNHPSELKLTKNEDGAYNVQKLTQVVEIHKPEYTRTCKHCGKTYYVIDKNNMREFCSMNCELKFNKK